MTYYFSLTNENAENFYSPNWIVLESSRVFGGGVIIKTPNNGNKLFRCNKLYKDTFHTLFEIDLSEDDVKAVKDFEGSGGDGITLIKLTNDKTVGNCTYTLLHQTANFGYAMPKPEWSWDVKPLTMKSVESVESENNFMDNAHEDFIQHYSEADSKINMKEIFKEMSMFESDRRVMIPEIKEVIFNYPATIVCWKDGTKTVVKCGKDEPFDREKAVAMCFIKKMLKPSKKCHWLDVIHDVIKVAEEKEQRKAEARDAKIIKKATNKAKAEQAKKNAAELQAAIQKLETKSLEEMNSKVEGKDECKDAPAKVSKNEVSEEYAEKIFDQAEKENKKWAKQANKGKKNKMDKDTFLACIKEDLTIDEIAEMNSWDKRNVARMYYKLTGKRPEAKPNTYSELDALFENGVSVDAASRRTGFSKNIVAMRYAKLQNKNK